MGGIRLDFSNSKQGKSRLGSREILGFWLFGSEGESAKNWEEILRELSRRGVKKVQLFITDDLPGIENVIKMVYPSSEWQFCVLHTVRNSLNKVRVKDRGLFIQLISLKD